MILENYSILISFGYVYTDYPTEIMYLYIDKIGEYKKEGRKEGKKDERDERKREEGGNHKRRVTPAFVGSGLQRRKTLL